MLPDSRTTPPRAQVWPIFTVAMAGIAAVLFVAESLAEGAFYLRTGIFEGQWWRLWTGHWVHYNASHFGWNLLVFLPVGIWAERIAPWVTRVFLSLAPAIVSVLLLILDPGLERYGGLSGVAAGAVVLLSGLQLERGRGEPAWVWFGVLALVGAKIAWELVTSETLLVASGADVRNVPIAHLGGILCAGAALIIRRLRMRPAPGR